MSVRFIENVNSILFSLFLLNDIFYLTDTDIFASFIREMIYKNTYEVRRNSRCSSGKLLLLFHYINMLAYCVVYKHC